MKKHLIWKNSFFIKSSQAFSLLFNLLRNQFRFKHVISFFEPKCFSIKEYWLSFIFFDCNGQLILSDPIGKKEKQNSTISDVCSYLSMVQNSLEETPNKPTIIPIWCLHSINPRISGVKGLLAPNIQNSLVEEIRSMNLSNIKEISTPTTDVKGQNGKTIINLDEKRILVIGNASETTNRIKTLTLRFNAIPVSREGIVTFLNRLLIENQISSLSSTLLIGAFGSIFGLEFSFLLTKVFSDTHCSTVGIAALFISTLPILLFLSFEAFEYHFVALTSRWTLKVNYFSWIVFLLIIVLSPFLYFSSFSASAITTIIPFFSIILASLIIVTNLGRVLLNNGYRKGNLISHLLYIILIISTLKIIEKCFPSITL